MTHSIAQKVNVNRRTLEAVLRVNPALAGGRSTVEFKDFLENGGSVRLGEQASPNALPASAPVEAVNSQRSEFEQALGFFVRTQTNEAHATLAELEEQKAQIEAAIEATSKQAEAKLRSFVGMLDPMNVAAFGTQALGAHAAELHAVGINPTNILV